MNTSKPAGKSKQQVELITPLDIPINIEKNLLLIGKDNFPIAEMRKQIVYHARSNGRYVYILDTHGKLRDWVSKTANLDGFILADGTLEQLQQFVAEIQEFKAYATIVVSWNQLKKSKELLEEIVHLSNIAHLAGINIHVFTNSVSNLFRNPYGKTLYYNLHQYLWTEQNTKENGWLKENLGMSDEQLRKMSNNSGILMS